MIYSKMATASRQMTKILVVYSWRFHGKINLEIVNVDISTIDTPELALSMIVLKNRLANTSDVVIGPRMYMTIHTLCLFMVNATGTKNRHENRVNLQEEHWRAAQRCWEHFTLERLGRCYHCQIQTSTGVQQLRAWFRAIEFMRNDITPTHSTYWLT